ncbi:MAG: protein translocase subunit SecD, partial [Treponema sp.]|nr:protein translocase subunit SecD [Treponema sp.]
MSKRYRFFIVLAVIGICFIFLFPTIRWYFLVPKEEQTLALGSREQIKIYASQTARGDVQELIEAARSEGPVPERLSFLVPLAKKIAKEAKQSSPPKWDAQGVLSVFFSEQEALDALETEYRERIFVRKDLQKNAVQLGLDLSGGLSIVLQADMEALREKLGRDLNDADREDAVNRA